MEYKIGKTVKVFWRKSERSPEFMVGPWSFSQLVPGGIGQSLSKKEATIAGGLGHSSTSYCSTTMNEWYSFCIIQKYGR